MEIENMDEKIDEKIELYEKKCNFILNNPYGINFREIDLREFMLQVFTRNGIEEPYEEEGSDEYLQWRKKKQEWDRKKEEWEKTHGEDEPFTEKINYDDVRFFRYNPIALEITDKKTKQGTTKCIPHLLLKNKTEKLDELCDKKFVIMAPITYVGNQRKTANARYLYAFCIDLDGVGMPQLKDMLYQMVGKVREDGTRRAWAFPANIVVNSGNGMHLYYLFETPVPLFKENMELLNKAKHALTNVIWNEFSSTVAERQYQSILQGFRLPDTKTKFGASVRAFFNTDVQPYSIEDFVVEFDKITNYAKNPKADRIWWDDDIRQLTRKKYDPFGVTLKEAERQWPEWYAKRVLRKDKSINKWHIKRDLYDWWLHRLRDTKELITPGHRYFCVMALAVYAVKCDIDEDEMTRDAYSLIGRMEEVTDDDFNHFTEYDVACAIKAYKMRYCTLPKNSIEYLSGLRMPFGNRRNGRPQDEHLMDARLLRDFRRERQGLPKWDLKAGRCKATAANSEQCFKVAWWRCTHQQSGNKSECARELEMDRKTIRKWWGVWEEVVQGVMGAVDGTYQRLVDGLLDENDLKSVLKLYGATFMPKGTVGRAKGGNTATTPENDISGDLLMRSMAQNDNAQHKDVQNGGKKAKRKTYKYLTANEEGGFMEVVIDNSKVKSPADMQEAIKELKEYWDDIAEQEEQFSQLMDGDN